jgi:DNA repair protein RadC
MIPVSDHTNRTGRTEARLRSDDPRERLEREGPAALADVELLALLLRTGDRDRDAWELARSLLNRSGDLSRLATEPSLALQTLAGLGPAKGASVVAAFEIGRRIAAGRLERGRRISGPLDVQRFFEPRLRAAQREAFEVLLLDGRHCLIAQRSVSVGTLTASLVHPREVFREAIRCAAAAMLLVHNHPSGDPTPSAEDRDVTQRLRAAGELLGIRVLDHVIVAEQGYFSFREMDPRFADPIVPLGAPQVSDRRHQPADRPGEFCLNGQAVLPAGHES